MAIWFSLFSPLQKELQRYLSPDQVEVIHQAYRFAADSHKLQKRASGEPYIIHPVSAALTLARMHLDVPSIIAALLHDLLEDTDTLASEIESRFGSEVLILVEGVSKFSSVQFESRAHAQAENLKKVMLAMTGDVRIILIRLADRLHNIETLQHQTPEQRRRISRETLEIYAPIANRIGLHGLSVQLEEQAFRHLYPLRSSLLEKAVDKLHSYQKKQRKQVELTIRAALVQGQIPVIAVTPHDRHLYSLYRRIKSHKRQRWSEVMRSSVVRVITRTEEDCYRVLRIVHRLYKPIPEGFRDYIAIPKSNGYQSLHTAVIATEGLPLEVQIQTEAMDRDSEGTLVASLLSQKGTDGAGVQTWIQEMREINENTRDAAEFFEYMRSDLGSRKVYIFTPRGEVSPLPLGATVLDLAYQIHSNLGDHCIGAKVDQQLVSVGTVLINGQRVEILTGEEAYPAPDWLFLVKTGKAKSRIRHYLQQQPLSVAQKVGQKSLERVLVQRHQIGLQELSPNQTQKALASLGYTEIEELYRDIGRGYHIPQIIADRMVERSGTPRPSGRAREPEQALE